MLNRQSRKELVFKITVCVLKVGSLAQTWGVFVYVCEVCERIREKHSYVPGGVADHSLFPKTQLTFIIISVVTFSPLAFPWLRVLD